MQYTVLVCTFVKELGGSISLIYPSLNSIKFSDYKDASPCDLSLCDCPPFLK